MNDFIGGKYSDSELNGLVEDKIININNAKYKELFKIAKYTFPTIYVNSNSAPTLCVYGGKDSLVGV